MSRKQFRSQASSSRAASGGFAAPERAFGDSDFGTTQSFVAVSSSPLSYVYEPPGLSQISNPLIVVALKNLQKKDSTTKSKALEDLQNHIASLPDAKEGVEDALLEAWIKLYPRTSIDSSRRVRQLAHTFQGLIAVSCGKRIAKHMPEAVGAWLGGSFDNDKLVSRASKEAFSNVFSGQDKQRTVWKVYQAQILTYCKDALFNETVQTLSDERITSLDDAEAKYARVIGTSLLTLANITEILSSGESAEQKRLYRQIVNTDTVWKFSTHGDAFVRRAVYRLLAGVLETSLDDLLDFSILSNNVLQASLNIDQTGSSQDYVTTLVRLTTRFPKIWTEFYHESGKKSAHRRLCQYIRKGSQGASPEFWNQITSLLELLPSNIIHPEREPDPACGEGELKSFPVLKALQDGIIRNGELRMGSIEAWRAYIHLVELLRSSLASQEARNQLWHSSLIPIIGQYVRPSSENVEWSLGISEGENVCVLAVEMVWCHAPDALEEVWRDLSSSIVRDLQTSHPEQSKDYRKSQDSIALEIHRWYSLEGTVLRRGLSKNIEHLFDDTAITELRAAIDILKNRNGKPYSAASVLDSAIHFLPEATLFQERTKGILLDFCHRDLPHLLLSPSSSYIVRFLSGLSTFSDTQEIYEDSVKILVQAPNSDTKHEVLRNLISLPLFGKPSISTKLLNVVQESLQHILEGRQDDWTLVEEAIDNPTAPDELKNNLLVMMTKSLSIERQAEAGLRGLEVVLKRNRRTMQSFNATSKGADLLSKLLFLTESSNGRVEKHALSLYTALQAISSQDDVSQTRKSLVKILKRGLDTADSTSLSISSLTQQAERLANDATDEERTDLAVELFPDSGRWRKAMEPFLAQAPTTTLAITNLLGGAIYLVDQPQLNVDTTWLTIERDLDGFSSALRMAWFVTKLIRSIPLFEELPEDLRSVTIRFLAIFSQLASDNLSVPQMNGLWIFTESGIEPEMVDLVADVQKLIASWLHDPSAVTGFVFLAQQTLLEQSTGRSPAAYHHARAYAAMSLEMKELHSVTPSSIDEDRIKRVNKSPNIIAEIAFLFGVRNSKNIVAICNKLIADLTAVNFPDREAEGFRCLLLLNCILESQNGLLTHIPQQRIVLYVRHIIAQLLSSSLAPSLVAEVYKTLAPMLPLIKQIYGSLWGECVDVLVAQWAQAKYRDDIPYTHSSLRLYAVLRSLATHDANEDLQESLIKEKSQLIDTLLMLLRNQSKMPDEAHQPRLMVNELLAREISYLQIEYATNAEHIYPIVASNSIPLQNCAYELLHRIVPKRQEQTSLDAALSKDYLAKLPEEILSLIIAAPVPRRLVGGTLDHTFMMPLRGYLLSWKLVFDHWTNTSYKVQGDYAASLKEGMYLKNLLDFAFEFLIRSIARPVDASKYNVESYTQDEERSREEDLQWLTIHLYYLSLKYLPSLSRRWWRDDCSRDLQRPVEAWTEKYISNLVIRSELAAVTAWLPAQDTDDQEVQVRVSPRAHELTASYPIDDQTMSIRVSLPPTYPLSPVTVDSVHRVGVDEKKWRSWLITTQGVINFSSTSGALVDGLVAWRKNVTGALKGQSECAICYSVVSADKQLPNKRCNTCKNLFHGSCLFRWFRSSGSSSCPLCRNAFNYG